MRKLIDRYKFAALVFISFALVSLTLLGCGGGGAGGVDNDDNSSQTNGVFGTGTGAGGIPIFWHTFGETNQLTHILRLRGL